MSATREQVLDLINEVAREWDGCEHDDSMTPDIGNAIRRAAYQRVIALFTELANTSGVTEPEITIEWDHLCRAKGEPVQVSLGKACPFCAAQAEDDDGVEGLDSAALVKKADDLGMDLS